MRNYYQIAIDNAVVGKLFLSLALDDDGSKHWVWRTDREHACYFTCKFEAQLLLNDLNIDGDTVEFVTYDLQQREEEHVSELQAGRQAEMYTR